MGRISFLIVSTLLVWGGLHGCAKIDPRLDYERAAREVAAATSQDAVFQPDEDALVEVRVNELLDGGLTVQEAVQIALLSNPTLQAAFYDIGMAHADVVQSGLLSNPSLAVMVRFPSGGGLANLEAGIAQNIADLWQIPPRKRAAQATLERVVLDVARQAAELAAETKAAYFEAVAEEKTHQIGVESRDIARRLFELSLARQQAGAGSELDVNLARATVLDAEATVETARFSAAGARRRLASLLGLADDVPDLLLSDVLPVTPSVLPSVERLEAVALEARLDLRVARSAVQVAAEQIVLEQRRVFPMVAVGLSMERDARDPSAETRTLQEATRSAIRGEPIAPGSSDPDEDAHWVTGPSFELEVPLFDQNQAGIAKAQFAHHQALKTLGALERTVAREVRNAVDRTVNAWRLVHLYRDEAVGLASNNLELARESYQAGKASLLAMLEVQRTLFDVRLRGLQAQRDAGVALTELEKVSGLPLNRLVAEPERTGLKPGQDKD